MLTFVYTASNFVSNKSVQTVLVIREHPTETGRESFLSFFQCDRLEAKLSIFTFVFSVKSP